MNKLLELYKKLAILLEDIIVAMYHDPLSQKPQDLPMNQPVTIKPVVMTPATQKYLWDTKENCRHSIRVICDEEGLTVQQKNDLSATLHCESNWNPKCVHPNIVNDKVMSTDYGICQWNDYYHGKEISPKDAVNDPEKAVRLMCQYVKRGQLNLWVCYKTGMFLKYSS